MKRYYYILSDGSTDYVDAVTSELAENRIKVRNPGLKYKLLYEQ